MRSELCLCLTLAVLGGGMRTASAQQQAPTNPPQQTAPQATPVDPIGSAAPGAPPAGAPQDEDEDEEKEISPKAHLLRVLPDDILPNPPKPEELKTNEMTWKGEYEADKLGKPLLGPDGKPLPVLYNKKGKRVKSKIKIPKTHPITIQAGTLTVDGWTGKARLNYDIPDLKYIYLSAPVVGTLIVSQQAFPGSVEQKEAFNGQTLTVSSGDHEFQLTSDKPLMGKNAVSAWVKVDSDFTEDPRYPVMGYGSKSKAPYEWPGAKIEKATHTIDAPPLPVSMQPKLVTPICIAGHGKVCPPKPMAVAPATEVPPKVTTPPQ